MNSRRSFFRSLAQTAALIALAPQLAFRVRPEIPVLTPEQQLATYVDDLWVLVKNEAQHNGRTYVSRSGLRARFINGEWGEGQTPATT